MFDDSKAKCRELAMYFLNATGTEDDAFDVGEGRIESLTQRIQDGVQAWLDWDSLPKETQDEVLLEQARMPTSRIQ